MKLKSLLQSLAVKVLSGILVCGIGISVYLLYSSSVAAQGLYPYSLYGSYLPGGSLLGGNLLGGNLLGGNLLGDLSYYGSPYGSLASGGIINPLLGGYYGSPFSAGTAYSPYYSSLMNSNSFVMNPYSPLTDTYSSLMNPYSSIMNPYSSITNPYNSYCPMMQQVYALYDYLNYSLQFYQLASKTPFLYMQDQTADYIGANLMNYAGNIGVSPQESILYFIRDNVLSPQN
jgi:hypothetical protein